MTELDLEQQVPAEAPSRLPVLPLKETVVFPESMTPLAVGQERSIKLIDDVVAGERMLALLTVKDGEDEQPDEQPGWEHVYGVGTVAVVHKLIKVPDGTLRILVQGLHRVRLREPVQEDPYLVGEFEELPDVVPDSPEVEALTRNVQAQFARIIGLTPYLPEELQLAAANVDDPSALCHLVASTLRLKTEERQELLELVDVEERLRAVSLILERELEVSELGSRIQSQVASEIDKGQREYFLRQQLKAIQEELGEGDEHQAEVNELRGQIEAKQLPEDALKVATRELSRLERLPPAAAEYGVIRTYLDWILSLPWNEVTDDNLDLEHAREILDEDHFDLEKVKERIIEYLAVAKLKHDLGGPILCFVGPPGVGKTSLGQSIARALGRKFVRVALGGVRDEADIRGFRRTYIGALPGRIIQGIRRAGSNNPVLMLDEVDKLSAGLQGDPAAALLELLDPEQNRVFVDRYLDVPFDMSRVLFIATANQIDTIPSALLDRMELLRLAGYTEAEKLEIARRYLIPRQIVENGLALGDGQHFGELSAGPATGYGLRAPELTDEALRQLIRHYTREAGVRELERRIGAIYRKLATRLAEGKPLPQRIDAEDLDDLLGPPRFRSERLLGADEVGVVTGLAWTPAGGDVLFVEASAVPGTGQLTLTGQLGDVMRESARAALTYTRARAEMLGIAADFAQKHDIHIHVPAGAVPKDGPSAGITMASALVSAVTGRPAYKHVAMTGEITLRGKVLPIGGVKEKLLAAQRTGVTKVLLPRDNEPDLRELPEETRSLLEIVLVEHMDEVLPQVLHP